LFFICVVGVYYAVIGWIYRQDLLRWVKERLKR
jgi:hypothetical protein